MDMVVRRRGTAAQVDWLRREADAWAHAGLVDGQQAAAITAQYDVVPEARRRVRFGRVVVGLGAGFVGVGLVWLVAANLDQLSPALRFGGITGVWGLCLVGGELLGARGGPRAVTGAVRLVAALAFGATVLQAAQSLQVPAYEPALVGWWAAGTLLHGTALRAAAPLTVGLVAGTGWLVWHVAEEPTLIGFVLPVMAAAVVAGAVATWYAGRAVPVLAAAWRTTGVVLTLAGAFAAALPVASDDQPPLHEVAREPVTLALLVAAVTSIGLMVIRSPRAGGPDRSRLDRWSVPVSLAALVVAVVLAGWHPEADLGALGVEDWAHAVVAVVGFALLATWYAALGALEDSRALTWLAVAALVVFTTVQAFAVFAPVIAGAWLFLALGAVLLLTGTAADRARRRLAAGLAEGDLR